MRVTLRVRLCAYILTLHLAPLACATLLLPAHPYWFIGVELLLVASLALGLRLVQRALEPLAYSRRFHDLLQDGHYANRLATPDSGELEQLVALFNTLLATLQRERLAAGEQRGLFEQAISMLNASAARLLGLVQPHGRPLSHWLSADAASTQIDARQRDLIAQLDALPGGDSRLLTDTEGRRYRAQRGHFHDRGFARAFLLVEELTAELEDSERATYARLIRVLAHEVNNTVAATCSVLDSLLFYAAQLAASEASDFSTAVVAVRRRNASLGDFIERFTRVVKMPEPALREVDLAAIVDDIVWLNREQCNSNGITLSWQRGASVVALALDAPLIEQALLNIVKNAIEAVLARQAQGHAGGHVRLTLAAHDEHALLAVSDSADLLGALEPRRLFTPFYSTKPGGQGIGLMFVREVLNRHGFGYTLAPAAGGETCFTIRMPYTAQA